MRSKKEFCLDIAFVHRDHIVVCEKPKGHTGQHKAGVFLDDTREATLIWDR